MADDFAISVGTPDRVLAAQIKQVFDNNIVNDLDPSDIGALKSPVAVTPSASVQPSVSGTNFLAIFSSSITGINSRFDTQLTPSVSRIQLVSTVGGRHNGGLITSVTNATSTSMTNFKADSNSTPILIPLDTGSPSTGTTIITQTSNLAFSIPSGSYILITSVGALGPYNMTLTDSNFALSFTYDSAYLDWATASSSIVELSAGVTLVGQSGLSSGDVYYLTTDRTLRVL